MSETEIVIKRRGRPCLDEEGKRLAYEKNKQRALNRIKEKYRDDPEFKQIHLQRAKEYNRKCREAYKIVLLSQEINPI